MGLVLRKGWTCLGAMMDMLTGAGNGASIVPLLPKSQPLAATLCTYACCVALHCVEFAVSEFVMVVWLAAGGKIEKPTDPADCARVLSLYQSSLAMGQPLLMTRDGTSRIVLDVRCARRPSLPVS
ncbi:MAG: hypothetical protein R3D44_05900 [Hyphomicrobiaceae bacterium]